MERLGGVALPLHPSYHVAGLLITLDEEGRNRAWREAIHTIAQINRIEWKADFGFLLLPEHGDVGLDHYLGWLRAWRTQACPAPNPIIEAAIDYLIEHQPETAAAELLWGDSNPGNFLFGPDGSVTAALDFEAAAIGPAEIDLAWWFVLDRMLAAGQDLPKGMPNRAEQIGIFEHAIGRTVSNMDYYEVLAATRMALVIAQTSRILIENHVLPTGNRTAERNPAAAMLAGMIGIEADHSLDDYMQMVAAMNQRS